MKSLLELISSHSSENSIMPLIALASIVFVIIVYAIIKPKWVKYIITAIVIIVGGVFMYQGYESMLKPSGLEMIIRATKVLTFGIVGFLFSMILDIIDSMAKMFKKKKKEKVRNNKKKVLPRKDKKGEKNIEDTKILDMTNPDNPKVLNVKGNKLVENQDHTKVLDVKYNKNLLTDDNKVKKERSYETKFINDKNDLDNDKTRYVENTDTLRYDNDNNETKILDKDEISSKLNKK